MKTKAKVLSALLAAILILCLLPASAFAAPLTQDGIDMAKTYCNPLNLPYLEVRNTVATMPASSDGLLNASSASTLSQDVLTKANARNLVRTTAGFTTLSENLYRTIADVYPLNVDGTIYLYCSGSMQTGGNLAIWSSSDYINWEYHKMNLGVTAPTAVQIGDKFYLCGNGTAVYVADTPVGPWTSMGNFIRPNGSSFTASDVSFFLDEDGRLYLSYSIGEPIMGCELDPNNPRQMLTEPVILWDSDTRNYWERFGSNNQNYMCGYTEGSQIFKVDGTYYLQIVSNGTENLTYCFGVAKSIEGPLGGYQLQKNNPVTYQRDGNVVNGAGHGGFVQDNDGNLVLFYTSTIGYEGGMERRLGMDIAYIDSNGDVVVPETTDTPQLIPSAVNDPSKGSGTGLSSVGNRDFTWASSYANKGRAPFYAFDNNLTTWWQPDAGDTAPALAEGFKGVYDISAAQISWKEIGGTFTQNNAVKYTLEYFDLAANDWKLLVDKSNNTVPRVVEYDVFDTVRTFAVRLKILGSTENITVGVADLRVFGENRNLAIEKGLVQATQISDPLNDPLPKSKARSNFQAGTNMADTYVSPLDLPYLESSRSSTGATMPPSSDGLLNASSVNNTLSQATLTKANARSLVRAASGFSSFSTGDNSRAIADVIPLNVNGTIYIYATGNMQSSGQVDGGDSICWSTTDYINWTPHQMNLGVTAPTAVQIGDKFYLAGNSTPVYVSDSPTGPWTEMGNFKLPNGNDLRVGDVHFFLDDDGRLYLNYSIGEPIMGCELNPNNPTEILTEPVILWDSDTSNYWERFGNNNQNYMCGYTEGGQIFKVDGTYYLQVATNGTENETYCIGIKKSTEGPLSGYVRQENNPVTYQRSGNVANGVGHGGFVQDDDGNLILFYTQVTGYSTARRIGMAFAYIDDNGDVVVPDTGDTPKLVPSKVQDPSTGGDIGLACVSSWAKYWASSYTGGNTPFYAHDGNITTWWQPADSDPAPAFAAGFMGVYDIYSAQIHWKELGDFTDSNAVKYTLEYFDLMTNDWKILVDKSSNTVPRSDEYLVFDSVVRTIAVRLNILGSTENVPVGVLDLRVFGENKLLAEEKGLYGNFVKFILDGNWVQNSVVATGKTVVKPADPEKIGYTFKGWYSGGTPYDFSKPVHGDLTLVAQYEESSIGLSTAAHNVKAGDYVSLNTSFKQVQNSNAIVLNYTFDGDLFDYTGFSAAKNATVLDIQSGKGFAKVTLMVMDYNAGSLGDLMIRANVDGKFKKEVQNVVLNAEFVLKDGANVKSISKETAQASFTTLGDGTGKPAVPGDTNDDGIVDLIDLSNMIDWFGINSSHRDWLNRYTYFDFDNNGAIDIYDVSFVARLIR